ncbi:hypothetical protein J0A68_22280 [Algoriphagus sp. H41]|uniref:Uncharacterized protein n=1 Tax=Algoriphagus oliviformis TaxID=2811231 RepID=A0ABS3CAY8_9BACT|nr:hypothetical protein [Algoriphagus oliviformis]MBN7813701.1 hypothetical protein [Algoriphagus oliviformis]
MSKRWFLFLGLYLACLSGIAFGLDLGVTAAPVGSKASSEVLKIAEVGIGDYLPDEARISRGITSAFPRQRFDESFAVSETAGLEFLACKLIRSYSELHLEDYAIQLMGKTIQVNAP